MSHYFTRPKASIYKPLQAEDAWYHDPMVPSLTVCDHDAVDTGLIDERGDAIMRGPDPIGFHAPGRQ